MSIPKVILSFFLTAAVFFAIDLLWLGLVAQGFYADTMGTLMTENVKWPSAILFYIIYIIGILAFVVYPAVEKQSLKRAIGMGVLFGLVCYATFDLVAHAMIQDFPLKLIPIDMTWGMVLTGSVSTLSFLIVRKLKG